MDDDLVKDCSCYRYECHGKDYQEEDDGADRHSSSYGLIFKMKDIVGLFSTSWKIRKEIETDGFLNQS